MSDIYAMGATPLMGLNIVGFPIGLPKDILGNILKGGADKMTEAGAIIAGGHTIDDVEPKYGIAVTGLVRPGEQITNAGARPGDRLVLTKPIGTGIITTALKAGKSDAETERSVVELMAELNKGASEAMVEVGVNACTDITGFGLLGHLREMVDGSGVAARVNLPEIPFIKGAWPLAEEGIAPGGTRRNLASLKDTVVWDDAVPEAAKALLADAQTSGGLLIAVPNDKVSSLMAALYRHGVLDPRVIGEIVDGPWGMIHVAGIFHLSKPHRDRMIAHAQAEAPNECCGILAGIDSEIKWVYRTKNVEASPVKYLIDSRDMFRAYKKAEAKGGEFLAFYHSHTFSEAYPSPTDVRLASWPEAIYLLVSLMDRDNPHIRAFQIVDGEIREQNLVMKRRGRPRRWV